MLNADIFEATLSWEHALNTSDKNKNSHSTKLRVDSATGLRSKLSKDVILSKIYKNLNFATSYNVFSVTYKIYNYT